MSQQRIIVETGRTQIAERRYSPEDGDHFVMLVWHHMVGFRTAYGLEWTLLHHFDDDAAGAAQASRIARKVQAKLDAGGTKALCARCWGQRVIYGSQAYCDEEPEIIAREREDALAGG